VVAHERQTEHGPISPCFGCGSVWFPGATLIKRFERLPERVIDAFRADAAKTQMSADLKCPDCGASLYLVKWRVSHGACLVDSSSRANRLLAIDA
jgi:hypothetical protein